MKRKHEDYLEMCAAYALGSLDRADQRDLLDHLDRGCRECEAAIQDCSEATQVLAGTVPAARPASDLRAKVLSQVRSTPRDAVSETDIVPLKSRRSFAWLPVAASILLAVVSVGLWQHSRSLQRQLDAVKVALSQAEDRLNSNEARLARAEGFVELYSSAQTQCFDLGRTGDPSVTQGRGNGCFNASLQQAFVVLDDFPAPDGRDFELWVLHGNQPTSLGIVRLDPQGHALLQLDGIQSPDQVTAFAVSLEPEGGSPQAGPSGPVVFVGAVSG